MEEYKDIKNFDQLIDVEHGKIGTESKHLRRGNLKCLLLVKL
jgi:hypothetical protein